MKPDAEQLRAIQGAHRAQRVAILRQLESVLELSKNALGALRELQDPKTDSLARALAGVIVGAQELCAEAPEALSTQPILKDKEPG